jgi:hypothetical protein
MADALVVRRIADGAVDASAMSVLAQVDPTTLGSEDQVELIRAWERVAAMVAGYQQEALAVVVAATEGVGLDADMARHEVGAALRLSPVTAAIRTRVAADLRDRLPGTLRMLRGGEISYQQAAHLADAVRELPHDLVAEVESRVLAKAPHQTVAETRRTTRQAVLLADPASALERHEKAVRGRTIDRMPLADAMEAWWISMPAALADEAWVALTSRATAEQDVRRTVGKDDPGLDALRVDALVGAILGRGDVAFSDTTPDDGAAPPPAAALPRCRCGGAQTAAVVLDLPTALGLADNPAELRGYGAIPGALGRAMAADRDWVRWTVDPGTRQVIDRGACTYRPSDRLRAFVAARDRVCGFSGCSQPAHVCDCDHIVRFGQDGRTVTVNLGPLCRQHHNAKTHGRWRLRYEPRTGVKTWTSPLGRTYVKGTDPPLA